MFIATFWKVQWQLALRIGRQDFDGAIRVLEAALEGGATDARYLEMIAQCHYWAKREEMAIASAKRALDVDAHSFEAIKLLSEIHARRIEHDIAASYVRRALEGYPQPLPQTPKAFFGILRLVSLVFPRLRSLAARAKEDIGNPNKANEQWYEWAKKYLAWYDETHGTGVGPTVH
jgi:tetratricopeptide (TPR) repeat protein